MKKPLLVISGPTGVGKTWFAEELAKSTGRELFNTDVFQFYSEIPVISNRSKQSMHFAGQLELSEKPSARWFEQQAESFLDPHYIWIGVGMYLAGGLYGFDSKLKGTPFQSQSKHPFRMLVLDQERDSLYQKLNQRVDEMIDSGALEEAKLIYQKLLQGELKGDEPGLKAIGLSQLFSYFRGESSLDESVESWRQETRRLAKRQWTWLRKFCGEDQQHLWIKRESLGSERAKLSKFFEIDEQALDFLSEISEESGSK